MGVGFRPFGHIAKDQIFESGATIDLSGAGDIGVENELCFLFGETVPVNADRARLQACVEALRPAFELNERRLNSDASARDRLEDNLSQYGIVVGSLISDFRRLKLDELAVSLLRDETEIATIQSAGHIDDHYDSLLALVRVLAKFGRQIEAGDHVITGAYARERVVEPSNWRGEFSLGIGSVEVQFK
jgi:2-keto-4-pentenoate hydratase